MRLLASVSSPGVGVTARRLDADRRPILVPLALVEPLGTVASDLGIVSQFLLRRLDLAALALDPSGLGARLLGFFRFLRFSQEP